VAITRAAEEQATRETEAQQAAEERAAREAQSRKDAEAQTARDALARQKAEEALQAALTELARLRSQQRE
jgi:hypothetical protein